MTISVVIPTIAGREHWLERCIAAYQTTCRDLELIVVRDMPTCGLAWQRGADMATGDYVHFSADDLEPLPGWWRAALKCVKLEAIPSPRITNPDGSLQSSGDWAADLPAGTVTTIARIPFMSRAQWDMIGPSLETHYFTDNWIAYRASLAGIDTVVCPGYAFVHHYAPEGRVDERMGQDQAVFQRACAA